MVLGKLYQRQISWQRVWRLLNRIQLLIILFLERAPRLQVREHSLYFAAGSSWHLFYLGWA